jgi:hypothetical protein
MSDASRDRFGGQALIVGGLVWTAATLLHPDVSTMALATSVNALVWTLVHWAYLVGDLLLITGLVLLSRSVARTDAEVWATLALVGGGLAFTLDAVSTGIHLLNFPVLTAAISAGTATAQATFDATMAVNASVGGAATAFLCMTVAFLGFTFLRAGWSPALAYVGIVLGAVQLVLFALDAAGHALLPATGLVANIIAATLPLWITVAGVAYARARDRAAHA